MNQMPDLMPCLPEILLACFAMAILLLDLITKQKEALAILGVICAGAVAFALPGSMGETFGGMFVADGYAIFFKLIFLVSVMLSMLISITYLKIVKVNFGEYYSLMLFGTVGMMVMASAGDLIVLYVGLELMAMSTYVLAGFLRYDRKSNEAAVKYFLLGAFASALLLYAIALTYGSTGTTDIRGVASYIGRVGLAGNPALLLAMVLFAAAFSFKVAAVPFHMWAPDVYEGAPTSVTAYMSVGPKAAAFAAMGRVFLISFGSFHVDWANILIPLAIMTMAAGNIIAIAQTNIKRMLAYSSIAHAGYVLLGVIAGTPAGAAGMMNYLLIYAFMNIGAFAIVILLKTEGFGGENIRDYEGLATTHPLAAALMLVFMFSLTGIPPTAGFMGKFYLFMAAVDAGYTWLVVVAVIFSAISAYFYLRIVIFMYMREPEREVQLSNSPALSLALTLTVIAVIAIGVLPEKVFSLAKLAVAGFGG